MTNETRTTENLPLEFRYNSEGDHDSMITLGFGADSYTCELYYFALHAENKHKRTDKKSFLIGIIDTLKGWHRLLQVNDSNTTIYLPFELSDQYTRWISCTTEDLSVSLAAGYCSLEGWAVTLSEPEPHQADINDFIQTGDITLDTTKIELGPWLLETIKQFEE